MKKHRKMFMAAFPRLDFARANEGTGRYVDKTTYLLWTGFKRANKANR